MYNFFKTPQFVLVSMKGTHDKMKYMYKQLLCVSPLFYRQTGEIRVNQNELKRRDREF